MRAKEDISTNHLNLRQDVRYEATYSAALVAAAA
jgi:hypothetical protein